KMGEVFQDFQKKLDNILAGSAVALVASGVANTRISAKAKVTKPDTVAPKSKATTDAKQDDKKKTCRYCKKPEHRLPKNGDAVGKSETRARKIIKNRTVREISDHDWYTASGSLAAHHLICSEVGKEASVQPALKDFGYDINDFNNGVMLPTLLLN